jgi:hypothetical protein
MVTDVVAAELDRLHERIGGRFARSEPRTRVREFVSGLVAGLERKNGWTLAERAGEVSPDGMQRLLRRADWDVDGVRDDVRDYVAGSRPPKRSQRDAGLLGSHRAFQAAFAPVHRRRARTLPAARSLGDAPIHRHITQLQADELVIGAQRQGVHLLRDAPFRPVLQPPPDRAVRAPRRGNPLISAAMH